MIALARVLFDEVNDATAVGTILVRPSPALSVVMTTDRTTLFVCGWNLVNGPT